MDRVGLEPRPVIAFEQDHPDAARMDNYTRYHPPADVVIVIRGVVVREHRPLGVVDYHGRGDVLEDVVLDEVIGAPVGLDSIALRGRILRTVEVVILYLDVRGLIEPDMITFGVHGPDVLEPTIVGIEEVDARVPRRIRVIHGQILDAIRLRLWPSPPGAWTLAAAPIRHVETWRDSEDVANDGRDPHELHLIAPTSSLTARVFSRTPRVCLADEHATVVGCVIELVEHDDAPG